MLSTRHSLHPLDPASAAFFWRSKADTLLKVDLTPNPIPATGIVRAKLDLGYLPDGVDLLEDMPNFTIQIDGTDVENLRQDEYDPKVFYFTPPVFGSPTTADYDLSWSGLTVDGEAYPDLTLEDFAKYTTELEEGIEMFSDAIGVSIEEATSRTNKETEDEGLSAEDAAGYYDSWLYTQVSDAMYLMNLHIDDRNITDDAAGKLDTMETVNSEKSAAVVSGEFAFEPDTSGGSVDSLSINVQAIDDKASESDTENKTAKFSISRWGQFNSPVTVNFTLTGTATNGTDYTTVPLSVTIPAHFNTQIVEIEAIQDGIAEGEETVTLALPVDPLDPTAIPIQASVTIND